MHNTFTKRLLLPALALALTTTAAFGQAKPPPPLLDGALVPPPIYVGPKPPPMPLAERPLLPDVFAFAQAYESSNEPTMLVLVGRDTRTFDQLGATATGLRSEASDRAIGGQLNLIDPEGNALKLASDIENALLQTPGMDLVDVSALTEADRRDARLLQAQGEFAAVELMATKVNAEVVLLVRLVESQELQYSGARYRVMVEALDVPRGRKIAGFAFDWRQGTDSRSIKRYANAITQKFMDQYAQAKLVSPADAAPRKYTVRLIGLASVQDLRTALDAFAGVKGVTKARARGMSSAQGTSLGILEVTFAGDPLDLVADGQKFINDKLGMSPKAVDFQSGTITLSMGMPAPPADTPATP